MTYLAQPATQQMQDWCSMIALEMLRWPGVKMGHIFGTHAFYHRKVLFAILPDKRTLDSSTAISFRAAPANQATQECDWRSFELTSPDLIGPALVALEKAYRNIRLRPFIPPPGRSKPLSSTHSPHNGLIS